MYRELLTLPLLLSFLSANNMGEYGWDIPNSSVNVGGYLDMTYDNKREEKFLFDDIAMLFSSEHERFDILGEVELSHISFDGKSNNKKDIDLNLERLQLNLL